MYPYHVEISNQIGLYQLHDGRFQLIKQGPLEPVMIGYKYILLKNSIADQLKVLDIDRIKFKPAIIFNRKEETEDDSYTQMEVNHHFEPGSIHDLNLDGLQFLLLDHRYLFVTPDLKICIEALGINWEFSKGLSNFG